MDIIINKPGKSLKGMSQTKQLIKVVEHHITNPVESFYQLSTKIFDSASSSQNLDLNIRSGQSNKIRVENKSGSEINLDKINKPPFENQLTDSFDRKYEVFII